MIPLVIFLLACVAIYLGCIGSAFSVLMRLSLRLQAERSDRPDSLVGYLDDPILLFAPVRLLLGLVTVAATTLIGIQIGFQGRRGSRSSWPAAPFVSLFELVLPMLIVGRDPERVLDLLLPTFSPIARALAPLMKWITRVLQAGKRPAAPLAQDEASEDAGAAATIPEPGAQDGIISGDDRQLLQSIVDFGDTLVREIMTPRPDIVAIRESATLGDLVALFREQEY
jgi:CBS domain containing-hemolysin-like protein